MAEHACRSCMIRVESSTAWAEPWTEASRTIAAALAIKVRMADVSSSVGRAVHRLAVRRNRRLFSISCLLRVRCLTSRDMLTPDCTFHRRISYVLFDPIGRLPSPSSNYPSSSPPPNQNTPPNPPPPPTSHPPP